MHRYTLVSSLVQLSFILALGANPQISFAQAPLPPPPTDLIRPIGPCWPIGICREVCVEFDQVPLPATWGLPTHVPGDVVHVESGVPITVQPFVLPWFAMFNQAFIEGQPAPAGWAIGSGQIVRLNNINLAFDFSNLGFVPIGVRFEFLDLGGAENLVVNGMPVLQGDLLIPTPGVTVNWTALPGPALGKKGSVHIAGPLKAVEIGGQELWIDRVCAIPFPWRKLPTVPRPEPWL